MKKLRVFLIAISTIIMTNAVSAVYYRPGTHERRRQDALKRAHPDQFFALSAKPSTMASDVAEANQPQ